MSEGAFGEPAPGSARPAGAAAAAGPTGDPTGDQPSWLSRPEASVPLDAPGAAKEVAGLVAVAREASVAVALHARWTGDPGRSPLASLTLAAEPGGDGASAGVVHLGPGAGADPLLGDRRVLEALAGGLGNDGVAVVAHDAKEMMRSLLPLGVDITRLALDTAVGRLPARPVHRQLPDS